MSRPRLPQQPSPCCEPADATDSYTSTEMPPDLRRQTFRAPHAVGLKRPEPRNTIETYASQLLGKGVVRSAPLEALGIDLDYPFFDGSHFKMHDGTNAEPVMVAYAITTVSQPVLVAVEPAASTLPHPSGQKRTRQNPHQSSTKHNAASTRSLTATTKPSRPRCAACNTTVKR